MDTTTGTITLCAVAAAAAAAVASIQEGAAVGESAQNWNRGKKFATIWPTMTTSGSRLQCSIVVGSPLMSVRGQPRNLRLPVVNNANPHLADALH